MSTSLTNIRLRAPVNVTWEITEVCNLQCRHCLSAELRTDGAGELDLAQCRTFIDELVRMQVFQVNFGGGEPFLRGDFLDIVHYAHSRGITICISTNGTTLDDGLVDELITMTPIYLQVSLDGARAETNDAIRGRTFERILAGVDLLAARGYPDLSLNMVVTRRNVSEIAEFDQLARHYGAKTRLSRFRPSGRGRSVWEDYRLSSGQLLELSVFWENTPRFSPATFFALTPEGRRTLGLNMCGAAKMTCAVAPDGSVYPCAFLCSLNSMQATLPQPPFQSFLAHRRCSNASARSRYIVAAHAIASQSATVAVRRSRIFLPSPWTFPTQSRLRAVVSAEEVARSHAVSPSV